MAEKSGVKPGYLILLALPLVAGILWIALGERDQATQAFLNRIVQLGPTQAVGLTGRAQAISELCGFPYNASTDAMVFKASGLRKSKLAKNPELRQAYRGGYDSVDRTVTGAAQQESCLKGFADFGPEGFEIPGLLGELAEKGD